VPEEMGEGLVDFVFGCKPGGVVEVRKLGTVDFKKIQLVQKPIVFSPMFPRGEMIQLEPLWSSGL
jgi:hypothetical protein